MQGHEIGNYTWDLLKLNVASTEEIQLDIQKSNEMIWRECGISSLSFRAPYAVIMSEDIFVIGLPVVNRDVDSRDWNNRANPD